MPTKLTRNMLLFGCQLPLSSILHLKVNPKHLHKRQLAGNRQWLHYLDAQPIRILPCMHNRLTRNMLRRLVSRSCLAPSCISTSALSISQMATHKQQTRLHYRMHKQSEPLCNRLARNMLCRLVSRSCLAPCSQIWNGNSRATDSDHATWMRNESESSHARAADWPGTCRAVWSPRRAWRRPAAWAWGGGRGPSAGCCGLRSSPRPWAPPASRRGAPTPGCAAAAPCQSGRASAAGPGHESPWRWLSGGHTRVRWLL